MNTSILRKALLVALTIVFSPAWAQNVKVTPLGSHAGELCDRDRATLFEDPTGVRILYDAGHSVTGGDDPRLGTVHVVLLSHAHGDHIGDRKLKTQGGGTCAAPETVSAAPNSTTAEIAAAKNAAVVMIAPMAAFIGKKIETIRSKPTGTCVPTGDDLVVPLPAPCLAGVQIGGARTFKTANATRSVEITTVPAAHDSTVARDLLTDPEKKSLEADNVSLSLGPSSGYVIRFTNGLVIYLSGDTAIHADMKTIVGDFHKPRLALFNLGPSAVTRLSAAYAINDLVRPTSVIVTHVNEAATTDGKLKPNSRTAAFIESVKGHPVYLALSGKTMEFDSEAKCVSGC
jgi:L-ascorbate metabolism protein UlaG (beta-lactamase superfamily)